METPREHLTPRKVSMPTECFPPHTQHPQLFSDHPLEGHLLSQQSREVTFLRDSTPAAREESVAASSLHSSGRTSSSSSSHADEEEDDDAEEHVLARLDSGVSSSEVTPEVFYPAVSHAAGGSRRFEDATGQQDSEDSEQAPLSQERTSSQDARDSYSKRADAADDAQDRNGCFSSLKGTPAEAKQSIQPETAEYRARAALRHTEGDVVHACSSLQGVPCSAVCIPSAVSPPFLQSPTSHTDSCVVNRSCLAGTSVAFGDLEGEQPLPDTSLTSSSMLSDCRSPETDFRGATCDSAEHSVYLQSYAFNQDNTCFLCATTAGFRVFTCAPLFEFMRRESPAWGEGCYEVAGMLFRTNVFALVSAAEQKKVKLWDDQKKTFIGELRSRQPVRNVCLGREILAVVTEYTVYVYQSEQMRPFSIIHTRPNPRGLCIITSTRDGDGWILACPAVAAGAVRVQTPDGDKTSHVFQAHQTPLAVMAFNSRGTWISTASETGTVIRIFCARDGQLLHELRRGTHSYAVTCLALRADDLFLAVASSSPTVHIFKLEQHEHAQEKHSSELINASTAEGALHPTLVATSSSEMRPAGICPIAESPNRSEPVSSAARAASTAPAVSGSSVASNSSSRAPVTAVPLQQALSVGKELTSVVYDASKEIVNDVIKGVFFKYFSAVRSFAQFHVPVDQQAIDVRSPASHILGPLCAFAGKISNHLYLLHPNGVFYEFRFDPNYGDECTLLTATTWFAPRPDFQIQSHLTLPSLPSELEGGHEGDEWQIVM